MRGGTARTASFLGGHGMVSSGYAPDAAPVKFLFKPLQRLLNRLVCQIEGTEMAAEPMARIEKAKRRYRFFRHHVCIFHELVCPH
jgi:hypothetical protein